jgi:hypothetical protein
VSRASDNPTTLPLTSPNWWPLAKTVPYVRAQVGSRDVADYGFLLAVNQYRVRVKIEQLDRRSNPPTLTSTLLLPAYGPGRNVEALLLGGHRVQLEARFSNVWMLRQCGDGPYLISPYALFFWAPDAKKNWPSDAEPAPEEPLITPKAWLKQALVDMPRSKDQSPGEYADYLYRAMKADSARLTRVYAPEGLRRALNRK